MVVPILKFNKLYTYNYTNDVSLNDFKLNNIVLFNKFKVKNNVNFIKNKHYFYQKKRIYYYLIHRIRLLLSLKFYKIFILNLLNLNKSFIKNFKFHSKLLFIKYFGFKFKRFFKIFFLKKKLFKKGHFSLVRQFNKYQKHMLKKYLRFAHNRRNLSRKFICYLKPYKFYRTLRLKKRGIKRRLYGRVIKGSRRFCKIVLKKISKYNIFFYNNKLK